MKSLAEGHHKFLQEKSPSLEAAFVSRATSQLPAVASWLHAAPTPEARLDNASKLSLDAGVYTVGTGESQVLESAGAPQ